MNLLLELNNINFSSIVNMKEQRQGISQDNIKTPQDNLRKQPASLGQNRTGRTRITFTEEGPLDKFFVDALQENVPISSGADLSLSISNKAFNELPPSMRSQLDQYVQQGVASAGPEPQPSGRRRILTKEEAGERLLKLIPKELIPKQ